MYNPKIWLSPDNLITGEELLKMYSPEGLGYNILRLMIYPDEADWVADMEGAGLAQQQEAMVIAAPWDPERTGIQTLKTGALSGLCKPSDQVHRFHESPWDKSLCHFGAKRTGYGVYLLASG